MRFRLFFRMPRASSTDGSPGGAGALLLLLPLVALLLGLVGCRSPFGDSGETVVVYTPFPRSTAVELKRAFEAKTGIRVIQVLEGTSRVRGRLRAEKENPNADVWYGGGGILPFVAAAEEGLLEPYIPEGYAELPVERGNMLLRDPEFRWTGMCVIALGFAYNPQVLSPDEVPQTWDELIEPRFHQQIEMWDPGTSGTAMLFLDSMLLRFVEGGQGEEAGWDFLKQFWQSLKRYTVEGKPAFNVARGSVAIGIHFEHQVLEFMAEQTGGDMSSASETIRWVLPPQSPVIVDPIALIRNAPNPENGKAFIDFVLSDEGQRIVNRYFFSMDPDIPPPEGLGDWNLERLIERAQPLDPAWMAEHYDRIRKRWQNEIEQIPRQAPEQEKGVSAP